MFTPQREIPRTKGPPAGTILIQRKIQVFTAAPLNTAEAVNPESYSPEAPPPIASAPNGGDRLPTNSSARNKGVTQPRIPKIRAVQCSVERSPNLPFSDVQLFREYCGKNGGPLPEVQFARRKNLQFFKRLKPKFSVV